MNNLSLQEIAALMRAQSALTAATSGTSTASTSATGTSTASATDNGNGNVALLSLLSSLGPSNGTSNTSPTNASSELELQLQLLAAQQLMSGNGNLNGLSTSPVDSGTDLTSLANLAQLQALGLLQAAAMPPATQAQIAQAQAPPGTDPAAAALVAALAATARPQEQPTATATTAASIAAAAAGPVDPPAPHHQTLASVLSQVHHLQAQGQAHTAAQAPAAPAPQDSSNLLNLLRAHDQAQREEESIKLKISILQAKMQSEAQGPSQEVSPVASLPLSQAAALQAPTDAAGATSSSAEEEQEEDKKLPARANSSDSIRSNHSTNSNGSNDSWTQVALQDKVSELAQLQQQRDQLQLHQEQEDQKPPAVPNRVPSVAAAAAPLAAAAAAAIPTSSSNEDQVSALSTLEICQRLGLSAEQSIKVAMAAARQQAPPPPPPPPPVATTQPTPTQANVNAETLMALLIQQAQVQQAQAQAQDVQSLATATTTSSMAVDAPPQHDAPEDTGEAEGGEEDQDNNNDGKGPVRKGRAVKFPATLHSILRTIEQEGRTDIACFTRDGSGFCVYKSKDFVDGYLAKHFKSSSFASFQRQINLYCFARSKCGTDNVYSHPKFHRDHPKLCLSMKRTKIKNSKLAIKRQQQQRG